MRRHDDLTAIRDKLRGKRGPEYWRSLEELAETPAFQEMLHREFPAGASEWWDEVSRRSFLKFAAASLALAGLTACTKQPPHQILPYVRQPEDIVPGEPLFYASAMALGGFARGVLVKSREGHPFKIEGNPDHPTTLGGSDIWMQASILDLYDPDRSQTVARQGDISSWPAFLSELTELTRRHSANRGTGLHFLTETITSPTLAAQLTELLQKFPHARWHQYEPLHRDNVFEGSHLAFGDTVETHYRLDKARVIAALDSDFLYTHPAHLLYTRQFAAARRLTADKKEMSRLYVAETTPSITGTMADHRLPASSTEIAALAAGLAHQILGAPASRRPAAPLPPAATKWLSSLTNDLNAHHGTSIVIAGEFQPPPIHAIAHLLNERLGNVGNTVFYTETAVAQPRNQQQSLRELAESLQQGRVETLFILGGNPAYNTPADLQFGNLLPKAKSTIHLSPYLDETSSLCSWHIPQAHWLESWSDARAFDGTVSLIQPLIAPLYGGKSAHELLGVLTQQQPIRSDYQILREFWRKQAKWPDFEKDWRKALHDGVIPGTQCPQKQVKIRADEIQSQISNFQFEIPTTAGVRPSSAAATSANQPLSEKSKAQIVTQPAAAEDGRTPSVARGTPTGTTQLELNLRPDPSIWDGRFANNGWLQECPRPVSKLTWDNALLVSPDLARQHQLANGDVLELQVADRSLRVPAWITPGQAANSLTLHLGYGRSRAGRVANAVGVNAYAIRSSVSPWTTNVARITRTNLKHQLVATQTHHNLESPERQVYRETTLSDLLANESSLRKSVEIPEREETLYYPGEFAHAGYKWGMSIDLTTCIGCNACLVACEVENNIPVVGKDQVSRHREMAWIRVDTYFKGPLDDPQFNHMPVPCMHCEHAPCELVCPVEATLHDHEGLNLQVYNRCVGTRFCSNNCPYKVRRFNFFQYAKYHEPSFAPMYNPDVTLRWRGVMEKCTYCIQRINRARVTAEKENRRIRDGEVVTACQQACPAEAIVFGDLNDPVSKASRLKQSQLDYPMLGQLNTRPRTTYLAKIRNPVVGNI